MLFIMIGNRRRRSRLGWRWGVKFRINGFRLEERYEVVFFYYISSICVMNFGYRGLSFF